jgi:prepilin-type N-terminal cleavage/methylation domain-containing protein/prepilin-type processing-associated H-X9-DG protein
MRSVNPGIQEEERHMRRRRKRGFTLLELLTVLATLGILAAILFPVFAQARARARQARCVSHLHQLAQAGRLYLADYDERFPSCYRPFSGPERLDLAIALRPYLRNPAPFHCPERWTVREDCLDREGQIGEPTRCMGYGYNWGSGLGWGGAGLKRDGLVRPGRLYGWMVGVTLAEVAAPSRCFFLGDTNDYELLTLLREAMPGVGRPGRPGRAEVNEVGARFEPPRHGGGNQFAFVDGHVQWLPFPGGRWIDGGPWVVPDMSMYSRTGQWETARVP